MFFCAFWSMAFQGKNLRKVIDHQKKWHPLGKAKSHQTDSLCQEECYVLSIELSKMKDTREQVEPVAHIHDLGSIYLV